MSLFPSINNISRDENVPGDDPKFAVFQSVEYRLDTIVDKINNIDNLNDDEIKNIIIRQHKMLLNYDLFLASSESRKLMQSLFTNKKFLKIFVSVIGLLDLDKQEIICINKLAYDYYILPDKDQEISELFMMISYYINSNMVIRLTPYLGVNGSRILAMIANSSFKDEKKIHRVNTFLIRCNIQLSIQDIINIYLVLYEKFMYPVIYTMLESKPANLSETQNNMFDNISKAILFLIMYMTSADIKKLLYNYAYMLKYMYNNHPVRFSIKSTVVKSISSNDQFISSSCERIQRVIYEIETDSYDELKIP
jgi:hypothetical protein